LAPFAQNSGRCAKPAKRFELSITPSRTCASGLGLSRGSAEASKMQEKDRPDHQRAPPAESRPGAANPRRDLAVP